MKFSYQWLAELVPGLSADARELGRQITMKTAECDGVEAYAPQLADVCVARVLAVAPLEGSKNVQATVDTGRYGIKTVACGAPNCRAGLLTAYWPLGKKKVSGIESDGMLCAGDELGINDDHNDILELDGLEVGAPLPAIRPDHIIEIDNKSLTHRPDLWGHHGMAREVAAIYGLPLAEPADLSLIACGEPAVRVAIENLDLCPRFTAVLFENVTVGPSPLWLQYRLEAIGLNPINNIVDITNYVMAELPQPMHAFDADLVPGHSLTARAGRDGEQCVALNGETYAVDPSMIVVAGEQGPLAIAGVMGGASSMIGAATSRVIFEAANWHPASIRKTSAKLKLRTDASMRFEKALDPENTLRGIARAIALMKEVCPAARLVGGVADVYRPLVRPEPIVLEMPWLERKLGRPVEQAEVVRILRGLEFGVEEQPARLIVTVPSWRATKDISMADDLVEEVGRVIGYASITPVAPKMAVVPPPANPVRVFHARIRQALRPLGFSEVQNYSFVSDAEAARFGFDPAAHVRVLNPIAEDQALLRISLIPRIHRNVEENRKHFDAFRIFEIGNQIHKRDGDLPEELPHLAVAVYRKADGDAHLNELKQAAAIFPGVEFRPASGVRVFEHPGRVAELHWRGQVVGRLFEFHPSFVEQGRAAVLELNLRLLQELDAGTVTRYAPVNRLPSSSFDIAVVTSGTAIAVSDVLTAAGSNWQFVEDYRLPDGRRSLLYRVTMAAPDRTLTSEEVNAERERLAEALRAAGFLTRS